MEDKDFAVMVVGYPGWFFFDYMENVIWFMTLCAEDGNPSRAFKRNELGQYEPFAHSEIYKEG